MANDRNLTVRFLADTGDLSKGVDQIHGKLQAVATGIKAIAAAGAAMAAADFLKDAIGKASDLGETTSKVGVIFGKEAAGQIEKFGATADKALGQSKQQAMDASATFGVFGKSAGLSGEALGKFSMQMTTLAGDMASFSNTTPEEAIEAIGSALRGEAEPIRAYGILLDDATLRQRALTLGLIKTTKDGLTPQQKVLAAQAEILAQTSDAQGDFARTSGGLANQQRIAAAQWENLTTKIGELFLPAVTKVIQAFNDNLVPSATKVGHVIGEIGTTVAPVAKTLGAFTHDLATGFGALPAPLQAGAAAFLVWKLAGSSATSAIGTAFASVKDRVTTATTGIGVAALDVGKAYTEGAARSRAWAVEQASLAAASGPIAGVLRGAAGEAKEFVSAIGGAAGGLTAAVGVGLKGALSGVLSLFGGPWGLALTTATVGLGFFMSASGKSAERQQELATAGKAVAEAIRDQGAAVTENLRKSTAKIANDAGLLKQAESLKLSLPLVTSAILGQGFAYEQIKGSLERVIAAGTTHVNTNKLSVVTYDEQAQAARKLLGDLDGVIGKKKEETTALERQAAASKEATKATDDHGTASVVSASSTALLEAAMDGLGLKYDGAKSSGSQLIQVIKGMTEAQVAAIDTEESYEASLDKLTEAINTNGATLDIHTEKGRENRDALEEVATRIRDMTIADVESGAPMAEAIQRHDARTAALAEEARKAGLNKDETNRLIEAYAQIPANVRTVVETQGAEAVYQQLLNMNVAQQALRLGIRADQVPGWNGTGWQTRAEGGPIVGPGGPKSDSVLLWGSNGEYVQKAAAVDYYGVGIMHAINNKKIPKQAFTPAYAEGGLVNWPFQVDTSKTKIPQFAEAVIGLGGGGAGVQQWAPLVVQVLAMLGQSASLLPNVLRRMNQESGGNPSAINLWDSNAQAGTPSQGLMQTIPGTFAAYAGPFVGRGILDPLANIYAGLNYAIHAYPSLQYAMDKPGGYRNGGWLQPGGLAYNETSKPEAVFNGDQLQALTSNRGGDRHYHMTVVNAGNSEVDIRTQYKRMEWLEG